MSPVWTFPFQAHLTQILQTAVDDGRDRLTLSLRIAGFRELDPRLGRWFRSANYISVRSNIPPPVPSALSPCGTADAPVYLNGRVGFRGQSTDLDGTFETTTVAVWPAASPSQRIELMSPTSDSDGRLEYDWDHPGLADGLYAWNMTVFDGDDGSGWSPVCHFFLDTARPVAPAIASADYPADGRWHGGAGVAGRFTFASTSDDVVSYRWRLNGSGGEANAPALGAPLQVDLAPGGGPNTLYVAAIDRAGNVSPETGYDFLVNPTEPEVAVEVGGVGLPSRISMSSPGAVSFGYQINGAQETRVTAQPDGTATATVAFPANGYYSVSVSAYIAGGLAGRRTVTVLVVDEPVVSWNGSALVFQPKRAGVTGYRYIVDNGELQTVAADASGVAVLPLTLADGYHEVTTLSVSGDGTMSQPTWLQFYVRSASREGPVVTSDLYGSSPEPVGGVGISSRFTFVSSYFGDTLSFVAVLNDGPEIEVQADPDGVGEVVMAPDRPGTNTLVVRSQFSDGSLSGPTTFTFEVA